MKLQHTTRAINAALKNNCKRVYWERYDIPGARLRVTHVRTSNGQLQVMAGMEDWMIVDEDDNLYQA